MVQKHLMCTTCPCVLRITEFESVGVSKFSKFSARPCSTSINVSILMSSSGLESGSERLKLLASLSSM